MMERFSGAGIPHEDIDCTEDTFTFKIGCSPKEYVSLFKIFYGPTMNAFDAAEKNGKTMELEEELSSLFISQNKSESPETTLMEATFLKVIVQC